MDLAEDSVEEDSVVEEDLVVEEMVGEKEGDLFSLWIFSHSFNLIWSSCYGTNDR